MPLLVPDVGEGRMLGNIVNKTAPQDLVLRLYTSNTTPAETDTHSTYTEASGSGYAAITLTGSSWTLTEGAPSFAAYAQQTFTFTADLAADVYGYYLTETTSGILKWVERIPTAPWAIDNAGDQIKLTPRIELS